MRRAFYLAALLVVAGLLYRGVMRLRPSITRVPAVAAGESLRLLGQSFGSTQGTGFVALLAGEREVARAAVQTWSDGEIAVALPQNTRSDHVLITRSVWFGQWASDPVAFVVQAPDLPSRPYGYRTPVQAESPWPTFRRDHRNTGRSPIAAAYRGDRPWSFKTGKGIFSTPVIDGEGNVYVGSADHNFYALAPDGSLRWQFTTGEIIDSAAALDRIDPATGSGTVTVPSGDGKLYRLRTDTGIERPEDRVLWTFDVRSRPGTGFNNWLEGNVVLGFDGTIYAGSTNFNYYALNPDGTVQWTYPTGSNNWSAAALADDGTIFWGSNDTFIRAVAPDGREKWTRRTLGFIAASAAVGSDGTVYIGSFDSKLYALDAQSGKAKWTFATNDHVYTSVALGADAGGNTGAIYFGSTDGVFYALRPDGTLLWKYDTGDPIRSSPALGRAPAGEQGDIVYFGSGNGKLYALDAGNGQRRWSFDTTSADPELKDRNDLNGSPALGTAGIAIGGEHGEIWYVPYDYCLDTAGDPRCDSDPGDGLPPTVADLFYVTPGGSTLRDDPPALPAATIISRRLIVRRNGETVHAGVCANPIYCPADSLVVTSEPAFPFHLEPSADGQYLHLIPDGFLTPGATYTITIAGDYYTDPWRIGNLKLGGRKSGRFNDRFTFQAEASTATRMPLNVAAEQVTAFEWTRLATPLPPMLPSLNQIGFDYMDWIVGTVDITEPDAQHTGTFTMWAVGGRRGPDGVLVVDPKTDFILPLSGRYQRDFFVLSNRKFNMAVTGITIPFNVFELRGQLGPDLVVKPGASAYADSKVLDIPVFGPYLVMAGLANNWFQKLLVMATYVTRPYQSAGPANKRPAGIAVAALDYTAPERADAGRVQARFRLDAGASYPASEHAAAILLVDAARAEAVSLDYHGSLTTTADAAGNIAAVTLAIPKGARLPDQLKAYVIADVFPLHQQLLPARTSR